jgi:hypothetical protein
MGDVVGWTYRKDWFSKPELQKEFKAKYGHDLAAPKTYDELKQIAEFFQKRQIDGKTVYGASIYTERGSEGITMGVTNVLYDWGFQYDNPKKPYDMEGFVNSADAVKGLEFYKSLYDCCTPPGSSNVYMVESADAFKSGQVAMQMNFAFTWPGLYKDEMVCSAGRSGQMVGTRRLFLPEISGQCTWLCRKPALRPGVPGLDGDRQGLLGRAELCSFASGDAEARSQLCRGRQRYRQGSARWSRQGLDRSLPGRRQALTG